MQEASIWASNLTRIWTYSDILQCFLTGDDRLAMMEPHECWVMLHIYSAEEYSQRPPGGLSDAPEEESLEEPASHSSFH